MTLKSVCALTKGSAMKMLEWISWKYTSTEVRFLCAF